MVVASTISRAVASPSVPIALMRPPFTATSPLRPGLPLPDDRVIDGLLAVLKSRNPHTRWAAATALGDLKDRRAVEPLIGLLRDSDWTVRYHTAFALGQIGDPKAGDALEQARSDEQSMVRSRAEEALRMLRYSVWRDREGKELPRGSLVKRVGPYIILRQADGATVRILLEHFAADDRKRVAWECNNIRSRLQWEAGLIKKAADEQAEAKRLIPELTEAIRRNPNDVSAYVRRGRAWLQAREADGTANARADCEAVRRLDPQSADLPYLKGLIEIAHLSNFDEAIPQLQEALRRAPGHVEAGRALARTYADRGLKRLTYAEGVVDLPNLTAELDEAVRLDPRCETAFWARGLARAKAGQADLAMADFRAAINIQPHSELAEQLGILDSFQKGDVGKAVAEFSEAVTLSRRHALDYVHRGDWSRVQGKYAEALESYDRAVRSEPTLYYGFKSRAWLRATCPDARYRDARLALLDAQDAYAFERSHETAEALAAALAEAGRFPEADGMQQEAIEASRHVGNLQQREREAMEARLKLYREGKPYREQPRPAVNGVIPLPAGRPAAPAEPPAASPAGKPVPRLLGIVEERREDDKWIPVTADEVRWAHDVLRFSPKLDPDDFSQVASFRLLKRSADEPEVPWAEFATAKPGEHWASGSRGAGVWAMSIEVRLTNGTVLRWPEP